MTEIEMPVGAQVLTAAEQDHELQLWALVDPKERATEIRRFGTYHTGENIKWRGPARFIGTAIMQSDLVFHAFELLER